MCSPAVFTVARQILLCPIKQKRRLRCREVPQLARGHRAELEVEPRSVSLRLSHIQAVLLGLKGVTLMSSRTLRGRGGQKGSELPA